MTTAYISEASYAGTPGSDFAEVAVSTGTDVTGWTLVYYNAQGDWLNTVSFPSISSTNSGKDVYVFNNQLVEGNSLAIVDDTGTTLQFLSFYDPPVTSNDGDLAGQTPTYAGVSTTSGQSIQSDDGGGTYYVQSSPNEGTVPCIAPGMIVACPGGPRPVEDLRPGDPVLTRDHGVQPVLWCSSTDTRMERPDFTDRPIWIGAGKLGALRDLIVSPQHRLLVPGRGRDGVLVPAKALVGTCGIRQMRGRRRIRWHHIAFARHELISVNGVWTESLLLGPMAMGGLPRPEARALRALFAPVDDGALNGPPARPCIRPGNVHVMHGIRQALKADQGRACASLHG